MTEFWEKYIKENTLRADTTSPDLGNLVVRVEEVDKPS